MPTQRSVYEQGSGEEMMDKLARSYPTSRGIEPAATQGLPAMVSQRTAFGDGYTVRWPTHASTMAGHVGLYAGVAPLSLAETNGEADTAREDGFEPRWLRPAVGGVALSPLLTWWTLLFALSMLARYEPGGWRSALDVDASSLGAPLRRLLDVGLVRVPELVDAALRQANRAEA